MSIPPGAPGQPGPPGAPAPRPLFHHDGSPAASAYLERLVAQAGADPGRELAVYRALPRPGFLAWFVLPAVVVAGLAAVISPSPLIAVVPLVIGLGVAALFVLAGWLDRVRVHERALVVGHRARTVVPLETLDPSRVYLVRGAFVARHVVVPSRAVHSSPGAPAVLLNGYQRMFSANVAGAPQAPAASPFGWYLLGVGDLPGFLRTLESAMVGHGLLAAQGLAEQAEATRQVRAGYRTGETSIVTPRGTVDPPLAGI